MLGDRSWCTGAGGQALGESAQAEEPGQTVREPPEVAGR